MKSFSDKVKMAPSSEPCKSLAEPTNIVKGRFKVEKVNDDEMLAFGWASVAFRADGEQIEDWQGDLIDEADLEAAAYDFVQFSREGGEMHERGGAAVIVESIVFTKQKQQVLGLSDGALPVGWWIGFRVTDPDVWDKVKDGTYPMFSIEGTGERVEV